MILRERARRVQVEVAAVEVLDPDVGRGVVENRTESRLTFQKRRFRASTAFDLAREVVVGAHQLGSAVGHSLLERRTRLLEGDLGVLAIGDVDDRADVSDHVAVLILDGEHVTEHPDRLAAGFAKPVFRAKVPSLQRRGLPLLHHAIAVVGVKTPDPALAHRVTERDADHRQRHVVRVAAAPVDVGLEYPDRQHPRDRSKALLARDYVGDEDGARGRRLVP